MRIDGDAHARAGAGGPLAEVWGDVVDLRHLGGAVLIGAGVSLALYFAAGRLFAATVASADVGRSYAMLVGLLACVGGGAIAARLFPPKRVMTEHGGQLAEGAALGGGAGRAGLPPETVDEMRALGLTDALESPIP